MTACIAPKTAASGYAHYGCRCDGCRAEHRKLGAHRSRMIAYGRWRGLVDADPLRAHVRALMAAGLGRDRICELAGVSVGCMARLLYGNRDEPPTARVLARTAEKLLAVQPSLADFGDAALIDATGTRRRAQALAALGWSISEQARRIGRRVKDYSPMLARDRVSARLARLVCALYDDLSMTPAPAGYSATRARRMAAQRGWLPPLAWEDSALDDPAAEPEQLEATAPQSDAVDEVAVEKALAGARIDLTDAELEVALHAGTARGEALSALSARLGMNHVAAKRLLNGEQPAHKVRHAAIAAVLRVPDRPPLTAVAAEFGVSRETVRRVWRQIRDQQSPIAS